MRSRISALVFSVILVVSFAGCSKKDHAQNQATQNQATTTGDMSSVQGNQPAAAAAPAGQTQPAAKMQQTQPQQAQPAATPQQSQQAQPQQAQQMQPQQTQPEVATVPAQPVQQQMAQTPPPLVVPAGTSVVVRMGNTINTKTANAGDSFTGTLAHSIAVRGVVAIPAGARVAGTVVDSKSPGRFKGQGSLEVALTSINVRGVPTSIRSSNYFQSVKGKGKRTAVMAGGGTGAGALIGGLAGGGKGALIGGLVGAGAGTAGAAFTGNKEVTIPAESVITFRLGHSITVRRAASRTSQDASGAN